MANPARVVLTWQRVCGTASWHRDSLGFHQCWVVLGWDPRTHPKRMLSPRASSLVLSEGGDEGNQVLGMGVG